MSSIVSDRAALADGRTPVRPVSSIVQEGMRRPLAFTMIGAAPSAKGWLSAGHAVFSTVKAAVELLSGSTRA